MQTPAQNLQILELKKPELTNTKQLVTTDPLLNRGMNVEESRIICTDSRIPTREKLFFRIIYETQLRPFEVLNLKIEDWDRNQHLITAVRVKQKTKPKKGNRREKEWLPSTPRTALLTENTNELLRTLVSNRKKGHIFVNENGEQLSLEWFNERINHYAKIIGIQKIKKYYADGRTLKLITCMALREAGERHHDNAGGSRKLSAVASGHTMEVKERHYEKVGEDFEQVHESYRKFHPAFVENW
ncbi:MAG TPA: tyrosine-type recombinase/integrase [candidate division Zixibacteria bacterium]|nr:tyrosine-type recombinase/integrase [candidate division Zixibacteria bacterium]